MINLKQGAKLGDHRRIERRWGATLRFVREYLDWTIKDVLDIGEHNEFGEKMAYVLSLEYHSTKGNLNNIEWLVSFRVEPDIVFCFEILEHLKNPDLFLSNLQSACSDDAQVFLSYPQNPLFLRGKHHFHEFKDDEFLTLIDPYFEVVAHKRTPHWNDWWYYFTGVRPVLRFFCQLFGLSRLNLYYLNPKMEKVN